MKKNFRWLFLGLLAVATSVLLYLLFFGPLKPSLQPAYPSENQETVTSSQSFPTSSESSIPTKTASQEDNPDFILKDVGEPALDHFGLTDTDFKIIADSGIKIIEGNFDKRIQRGRMTVEAKNNILSKVTFLTDLKEAVKDDYYLDIIWQIGITEHRFCQFHLSTIFDVMLSAISLCMIEASWQWDSDTSIWEVDYTHDKEMIACISLFVDDSVFHLSAMFLLGCAINDDVCNPSSTRYL